MANAKPKLAIFWASSCGGCEVSVVNLHERLLDVVGVFDLVFCPCLVDTKKKDIEAMADGDIALTLFNGAIRTDENEEWAHLLRRKSKLLVAFGACALSGGIPGLSNLHDRRSHWEAIYLDNLTVDNPDRILPQTHSEVAGVSLSLPAFHGQVRALGEVVEVDYSVPGCPPESDRIWDAVQALLSDAPPPRGAVVGCGSSSVCDECARVRTDKKVERFRRVWEFVPDHEQCLLEQGLLCLGVATRNGCGGLCPAVNMPCIGCYGPCEGVIDQASKMVSTLGSILDIAPIRGLRDEAAIEELVEKAFDALPDIAGTAGRFQLAESLRRRPRAGRE